MSLPRPRAAATEESRRAPRLFGFCARCDYLVQCCAVLLCFAVRRITIALRGPLIRLGHARSRCPRSVTSVSHSPRSATSHTPIHGSARRACRRGRQSQPPPLSSVENVELETDKSFHKEMCFLQSQPPQRPGRAGSPGLGVVPSESCKLQLMRSSRSVNPPRPGLASMKLPRTRRL